MAQVINTNVASLNAQRQLNKSQSAMQTNLQRLSSGLRINSAKDDAAGLAISNRFGAQINGLNQASRNSNDGISLAQTAEGALDEVTNGLQRMRTLAVQAANDTNSTSDRESIQLEIEQIKSEIDRIGNTTQFNGKNLLDGSNKSFSFQVGANAGQQLSVGMADMRTRALGSQQGMVETVGTRVALTDGEADGNIGVGTVDVTVDDTFDAVVLGDVKIAIKGGSFGGNDVTDPTAPVPNTGVDIAEARYGGTITSKSTVDLVDTKSLNYGSGLAKDIAARVNEIAAMGEVDNTGKVIFEGVNATARTEFNINDAALDDITAGATAIPAREFSSVGAGKINHDGLVINGVNIGPVEIQAKDANGALTNAINSKSDVTGVTASIDNDGRLNLAAADGRDIVIETNASAEDIAAGNTGYVANLLFNGGGGSVNGSGTSADDFTEDLSLRITGQVTYAAGDTIQVAADSAKLTSAGLSGTDDDGDGYVDTGDSVASTGRSLQQNVQAVGTIAAGDVTTVAGANRLMESVDSALKQVDGFRANLGAVQNRFEMTIRNLDNVSENLSAANSRIRDADFAAETTAMTRNQILQQAGVAMLSQANQSTQGVMSLLR